MKNFFRCLLFLVGLSICLYPLISNLIEQKNQNHAINTYENHINEYEDRVLNEMKAKAHEYNDILFQTEGLVIESERTEILNEEYYYNLMDVGLNGVMGCIEIPKINVNLPIYHGTSDELLSIGAGHLYGTSLPVGGINTRTVLTGHRGLPNSKLFTRLDELIVGDLFYIQSLDQKLAYSVTEIEVIEPSEVHKLSIRPEKDLVTLVTCTPYGINTHRLIVTGESVDFEHQEYESIDQNMMSIREIFFFILPFAFLGYGLFKSVVIIKRKRR